MRLAAASERRSQQPPDQTSAYRCGRSRLRRLGQPYQPSPRPEFFTAFGQERKPGSGPLCADIVEKLSGDGSDEILIQDRDPARRNDSRWGLGRFEAYVRRAP